MIINEKLTVNEKIIVYMIFGSHLYGTNTPDSDTDYKGVFFPTKEQIFLGRIPKSYSTSPKKTGQGQKNTSDDTDIEIYSLHYFLKLACEGQTVAIDMLHAPSHMLLESSEIWDFIVGNKHRFYSRDMDSFIRYARKQAAKYGIKGSRLAVTKEFIDLLNSVPDDTRLSELWNKLPDGEHCYFVEDDPKGIAQYQICGKKFQATSKALYVKKIVQSFYDRYGERAKQAELNQGIDWKAVSHALRAAYQTRQILTEGTITYPLKESGFLRDVKQGYFHYTKYVGPVLEALMDELEELSKNSDLPATADRKYWDTFLIDLIDATL